MVPGFKIFAAALFDGAAAECCGQALFSTRESAECFLQNELIPEILTQMCPERAREEALGEDEIPFNIIYRPGEIPVAEDRLRNVLGPKAQIRPR